MKVSDCMTADVITVLPTMRLRDAWDLMRRHRIEHLLVTGRQWLLGTISDRDIRRVLASRPPRLAAGDITPPLDAMTVADVMARSPVTIEPDCSVSEASAIMLRRGIGALPVVGPDGVCGIITESDVLGAFPPSFGVGRNASRPELHPVTTGR